MRNFAICGDAVSESIQANPTLSRVDLWGVPLGCAVISGKPAAVDEAARASNVLVRVRAFSCGYRDRELVFRTALLSPENSYLVIGTDCAGEVVEAPAASGYRQGERVALLPAAQGLGANRASRELQWLPPDRLLRVPERMSLAEAAAFATPAALAFSLVRAAGIHAGMRVLVASARSTVGLALIQILHHAGAEVHALTTSAGEAPLAAAGARQIYFAERRAGQVDCSPVLAVSSALGGFDAVFDPFFDLHFTSLIRAVKPRGKYAACGMENDLAGSEEEEGAPDAPPLRNGPAPWRDGFVHALMNNVTLCFQGQADPACLPDALASYAAGRYRPPVDQVFQGADTGAFVSRAFAAAGRAGRAVFLYD